VSLNPHRLIVLSALTLLAGCETSPKPTTQVADPIVALPPAVRPEQVHRVSTAVPFPRGLVMKDGKLYALARGRVRESGGVDAAIDDQAGTIFTVDPNISQPVALDAPISDAVRANGVVFAAPTSPPFVLFDRTRTDAVRDRETDRPYCGLRYDPTTQNFFLCAFSGIDKPEGKGSTFSKNLTDAVFRYDTRSKKWYTIEQHNIEKGGLYPHQDPASNPPPHGWLNGPDNCLVVGQSLYAVAKDNSLLVRYDLSEIAKNPDAPPPPSDVVLDDKLLIEGAGLQSFSGHSMLAYHDGFLYVGYRTSSVIVRFPLNRDGTTPKVIVGQVVARFDPYDAKTRKSANLTDMVFGPEGDLYVVSAQPARIYRFRPDPARPFDGRTGAAPAWAEMAKLTNNPKMKSENLLVDDTGRVFVTSGDAYDFQYGAGGTIYRIDPAVEEPE
jgi:hypothetical protein